MYQRLSDTLFILLCLNFSYSIKCIHLLKKYMYLSSRHVQRYGCRSHAVLHQLCRRRILPLRKKKPFTVSSNNSLGYYLYLFSPSDNILDLGCYRWSYINYNQSYSIPMSSLLKEVGNCSFSQEIEKCCIIHA